MIDYLEPIPLVYNLHVMLDSTNKPNSNRLYK